MPRAGGRVVAKQVLVAIVGAHLVQAVIWAVPLLDNLLHHVVPVADPEADRTLVRLSPGVALDLYDHFCSIIQVRQKLPLVHRAVEVPVCTSDSSSAKKVSSVRHPPISLTAAAPIPSYVRERLRPRRSAHYISRSVSCPRPSRRVRWYSQRTR